MANARWDFAVPALPTAFTVSSFRGAVSNKPRVITEMAGATKSRGRFTHGEDAYSGSLEMNRLQLIRFIQFYENDIGDAIPGTRWGEHKFQGFNHPIFETDAVWLFGSPEPEWSAQGPTEFLVTMSLILLPEDPEP